MRLGYYQTAGMMPEQQMAPQQEDPSMQMLQAFFEMNQMNEQQIQQFMQEFQQMAPEEQQKVMEYIAQQVQGGGQEQPVAPEQQMAPEQQIPPQEQMAPPMQMGGRNTEWLRYQAGAIANETPTYTYEDPHNEYSIMAADAAYPVVQRLPQYQPMVAPVTTVTDRLGLVTPNNAVVAPTGEVVAPTPKRKTFDPAVQALQKQLIKEGYNLGKYGADGIAGKFTKAAIKAKAAGNKPNDTVTSEAESPISKRDASGKVTTFRDSRTNSKGELPEMVVTAKRPIYRDSRTDEFGNLPEVTVSTPRSTSTKTNIMYNTNKNVDFNPNEYNPKLNPSYDNNTFELKKNVKVPSSFTNKNGYLFVGENDNGQLEIYNPFNKTFYFNRKNSGDYYPIYDNAIVQRLKKKLNDTYNIKK